MPGKASNILLRSILAASVALSSLSPMLATAQTVDHPSQRDGYKSERRNDVLDGEIRVNRNNTKRIVDDIASIRIECEKYEDIYRIDCLRQGIAMIAASIPARGEYAEARKILRQASKKLDRIVATYGDPGAPRVVAQPGVNPRFKKRRTYKAIKRAVLKQAMAEATAAVSEASTLLLRSSENSERRLAHYQDISLAVDSTKTLLRSS